MWSSANAAGFQAMVIGRILVGFGIGVSSGVVPLYISEVNIMLSNPHYAFAVSKAKMEQLHLLTPLIFVLLPSFLGCLRVQNICECFSVFVVGLYRWWCWFWCA